MSKVIVIRGNSGSGKTTVATEVHNILGEGNLLISQDYIRRVMLKVKDKPRNLAIEMIKLMIEYGIENCEYTIVEGILSENKYGEMLRKVLKKADVVNTYYYDLTFEETIRRHKTKRVDFDRIDMEAWFTPQDFLRITNEKILSEKATKDEVVKLILSDLDFYISK